ncbi:MAG: hypothetical protein GX122_04215, partial [Candidatus Cloacimonetes bacterium]|nr:hypothetical protein [Candidatus Cloacimonadota bacterium]
NESSASNTVYVTPEWLDTAIIGTGTDSTSATNGCPINVYLKSLHGQSVYLASELIAAGVQGPLDITEIGFYVTEMPVYNMENYIIRMRHTTATDVSAWINNSDNGYQTVYTSASYMPSGTGWNMFTFSTPFTWNGVDNIVVDTAFGVNSSSTASGTVQYSSVTNGYRYVRSTSSNQTNVFSGNQPNNNRPNLKLTLAPTPDVYSVAYANIKVFLEGPYISNGMMSYELTDVLPLNSPYDNEEIEGLPDVSPRHIVDWVQVQLRLTETGEEEHTFNAFLLDNGYLVNTDGNNGFAIDYTPGTSYYIIVRHRNHLGIMSAQSHEFSITPETAPQIDLTVLGSIYGPPGYGAKQLSDGVLALFAGDADGDGQIFNNDRNFFWMPQAGSVFGYHAADFDLDGWVFNSDLNFYWRLNVGSQSRIP